MSPIKIGDVVWVAELPSCGCDSAMGHVFQVTGLHDWPTSRCAHCGAQRPPAPAAFGHRSGFSIELFRLRPFKPLEELDEVKKEEAIHA